MKFVTYSINLRLKLKKILYASSTFEQFLPHARRSIERPRLCKFQKPQSEIIGSRDSKKQEKTGMCHYVLIIAACPSWIRTLMSERDSYVHHWVVFSFCCDFSALPFSSLCLEYITCRPQRLFFRSFFFLLLGGESDGFRNSLLIPLSHVFLTLILRDRFSLLFFAFRLYLLINLLWTPSFLLYLDLFDRRCWICDLYF